MWATRCVHEATHWKFNCFITLTYKKTPPGGSLNPHDTKLFIRNLRYALKKPFKYFLVGEYGEKNDRPHYHAIIFGHDFGLHRHHLYNTGTNPFNPQDHHRESTDLTELKDTLALRSPQLDNIWGLGHTSVGAMTFDSAAYCAQYAMKKVNGFKALSHYETVDTETGAIFQKHPEFMRRSQDGIGKQYALSYASEIIQHNSVISNGAQQPIPNYYLKLYEKQNYNLTQLKQQREEFSETHTIEKSYIRAMQLDSKFKHKLSKADAFRVRYAKDAFFDLTP